jgi:hypothetical protein
MKRTPRTVTVIDGPQPASTHGALALTRQVRHQQHWFGESRLGTTSYSEPSPVKRKRKRTDDSQYVTLQRQVHVRTLTGAQTDRRLKRTDFMGLLQVIHRHKIVHARCLNARLADNGEDVRGSHDMCSA